MRNFEQYMGNTIHTATQHFKQKENITFSTNCANTGFTRE